MSESYPLIVLANRDEYFARETESARWWPEPPEIYAGRDLQAGGTWMGVNRKGQFAAVTNVRGSERVLPANPLSRGKLVTDFLSSPDNSSSSSELESRSSDYRPFNLVSGDCNRLQLFHSETGKSVELSKGIHSISNGDPRVRWPKMRLGCELLEEELHKNRSPNLKCLHSVMCNQNHAPSSVLPATGIPENIEKKLSSIFIPNFILNGGHYGTRSTSMLLQSENQSEYFEWNYDLESRVTSRSAEKWNTETASQ